MEWKKVLKQTNAIEEVEEIIDFVKNKMRPQLGQGENFVEEGELTEEIASNILHLFENGKQTRYSQISDRRGNTELNLYIDDGFDLLIMDRSKGFHFHYSNQYDLYKNLHELKISPQRIERTINDFLGLIGRVDLMGEHGLTAEIMNRMLEVE